MLDLAGNAIVLFFKGKLFKDIGKVFAWIFAGALFTAAVLVAVDRAVDVLNLPLSSELSLVLAAAVAGFLGGMLQPYLFKDLKYH